MYDKCHSFFYNALEELKEEKKEERKAQSILSRRYDVKNMDIIGIDMLMMKKYKDAQSQVLNQCF